MKCGIWGHRVARGDYVFMLVRSRASLQLWLFGFFTGKSRDVVGTGAGDNEAKGLRLYC